MIVIIIRRRIVRVIIIVIIRIVIVIIIIIVIIILLRVTPPTSGHGGLDQAPLNTKAFLNIKQKTLETHARLPGESPGAGPELALGKLSPPGRLKNVGRYSMSCSWSLLDHSLNLRTPQEALRNPPRRSRGALEHVKELSSRLQGPSFELPSTSRSSPAASRDRVSSSRTHRGALKQPPRTESRAPEHLEELSSSLQGTNFELPSKQARKKASKAKESKQANNRASKQAIKRANEQTSKRASEHTTKRTNNSKQARGRRGAPKGLI